MKKLSIILLGLLSVSLHAMECDQLSKELSPLEALPKDIQDEIAQYLTFRTIETDREFEEVIKKQTSMELPSTIRKKNLTINLDGNDYEPSTIPKLLGHPITLNFMDSSNNPIRFSSSSFLKNCLYAYEHLRSPRSMLCEFSPNSKYMVHLEVVLNGGGTMKNIYLYDLEKRQRHCVAESLRTHHNFFDNPKYTSPEEKDYIEKSRYFYAGLKFDNVAVTDNGQAIACSDPAGIYLVQNQNSSNWASLFLNPQLIPLKTLIPYLQNDDSGFKIIDYFVQTSQLSTSIKI